jgi:hypothetical protein
MINESPSAKLAGGSGVRSVQLLVELKEERTDDVMLSMFQNLEYGGASNASELWEAHPVCQH